MRGLAYMASTCTESSRDKVDEDTIHKGIQCALEKLGTSKFGFERTVVSKFKGKRRVSSGNELVDYSRAPCLGADQKARGVWVRDCRSSNPRCARICLGGYWVLGLLVRKALQSPTSTAASVSRFLLVK